MRNEMATTMAKAQAQAVTEGREVEDLSRAINRGLECKNSKPVSNKRPSPRSQAHGCIESVAEFAAIEKAETPLNQEQFLKADPTEVEPWRGIMLRNTPGQAGAGAPVFLAQGTADTTVRPEITKQFGEALCKQGDPRELHPTQRREPHPRRQEQRRPGTRLDGRTLQGHAGAVRLPALTTRSHAQLLIWISVFPAPCRCTRE